MRTDAGATGTILSINRALCGMSIAFLVGAGCAKKPPPIDYSKGVCLNGVFYLKDAQVADLTLQAGTNSGAAFRLYTYYGGWRFDTATSLAWLKKAAEQGDAKSQYNLAMHLRYTPGYENLEESKKWMNKAASQRYKGAAEQLVSYPK